MNEVLLDTMAVLPYLTIQSFHPWRESSVVRDCLLEQSVNTSDEIYVVKDYIPNQRS